MENFQETHRIDCTRNIIHLSATKMKTSLLVLLAFASSTDAWTGNVGRRELFERFASAAAVAAATTVSGPEMAQAATAKTGAASPFTGDYDDPNHPGCLRQVKVVGAPLRGDGSRSAYPVVEVVGYDGDGSSTTCSERPTREQLWKIQGTVKSNTLASIDFSPKGGPGDLLARFEDGGIVFPDGNKWTKVFEGTPERLPKDMSTLKSN